MSQSLILPSQPTRPTRPRRVYAPVRPALEILRAEDSSADVRLTREALAEGKIRNRLPKEER